MFCLYQCKDYCHWVTTQLQLVKIIVIIIIIIIIIIIFQRHLENTCATYQETIKSRNYRIQPYWALHTYFGKY